jgi:ribosomal protein L11 methyltransferase
MTGCQESEIAHGTEIQCFFKDSASRDAAVNELIKVKPDLKIGVSETADQDWNARWKASMKPALIAPGTWASPVWLPPKGRAGDIWIKIEPKMAFGTGHHATTRLAAAALLRAGGRLPAAYALLDIGCGSGILCFLARLNGAVYTAGVDIDPDCAENLAENRGNNPSRAGGGFAVGGVDMFKRGARFDCAVMNMISSESQPLLDRIAALLLPRGLLLWSGILIEEKNDVVDYASTKGFMLTEESTEEEWWCGAFIHG